MSPTFEIEKTCINCGATITAREQLSALDAFVLHVVEIVWCSKCGTEQPSGDVTR